MRYLSPRRLHYNLRMKIRSLSPALAAAVVAVAAASARAAFAAAATFVAAAVVTMPTARADETAAGTVADSARTATIDRVRDYLEATSDATRREILATLSDTPIEELLAALPAAIEYPALEPGISTWPMRVAETGEESTYVLVLPPNYDPAKPWPAWLALHGTGGVGAHSAQFLDNEVARSGFVAVCPTAAPDRRGKGWDFSRAQRLLSIAALDDARRRVNIDADRVVIGGWSRGGHGTYDVAVHHPALFSAANPVAGAPRANYVGMLRNLGAMRMHIVNGANDEALLIAAARSGVELLTRKVRADVRYIEDPERGHDVMLDSLPAAADACLAAVRDARADRLLVAAHGDGLTEASWLRIDELAGDAYTIGDTLSVPGLSSKRTKSARLVAFHKAVFEATASVDARRGSNAFTLKSDGVRRATLLLHHDAVRWGRSVRVTANGRRVFSDRIEPSAATLLDGFRARRDLGRLFVAELTVDIPE